MLARNVKNFIVECWDTNKFEWATEWTETNSIPPFIRVGVVLTVNDEAGNKSVDTVVTRAFAVPSEMMPAAVQHGSVGGP